MDQVKNWSVDTLSWHSIKIWHLALVTDGFQLLIAFHLVWEEEKIHLVPKSLCFSYLVNFPYSQALNLVCFNENSPHMDNLDWDVTNMLKGQKSKLVN